MSKIFDALKRSEGERTGNETTALPQGPDLLRDAERRVASSWDAIVSVKDSDLELEGGEKVLTSQFVSSTATPGMPLPPSLLKAGGRVEISNRFATLPIAIAPESHLACLTDRKSPTAEAVRLLAVRLRDLRRSRTLKKIVITSTIPREGKSTIAANLACALGRRVDERVLLIEGDLRLPTVLRMFGVEPQRGLCELLRGDRGLAECIFHLPDADLWVLPAGSASNSNPLELLQSQKMSSVMDELSTLFDWIVIDSPPVLPLADTSIWMRISDGVLLVTRQGVTEKKQFMKGLEALEPQKVLGALLNGSKASRYSSYYYGESGGS
jgi:capsular exopolysaccharide synthesis family protein